MGGGSPAALHLRRLRRALDAAELRYSPLLHSIVNVVTAWDLHVLAALERWQRRAGPQARAWFAVLGELEALAALATLLHDHPDWALPEVDEGADRIEAEGLGHPLLPPSACVRNDAMVGPAGTFLFVTGSNMAGKSTLLRAVGANAVLAQAGGPVCARRLRMPPAALLTSMRVSDSLEEGLSFFMAELVRLKGVVEAARRTAAEGGGRRALYLLDEILQGTNSAERQVAARRIVERLLEEGAIGAVSTHDLALADTPTLAAAAQPVHFRETLEEGAGADGAPTMRFDYELRPGPATSANALALVRMMGLD
jgi:DNA mismatch repair ATPase MutS